MRAPGAGPSARTGLLASVATVAILVVLQAGDGSAKPTIYVKNDNDKLEPVLVPVSSTVIPLPVYKVGFSLGAAKHGDRVAGADRPDEPIRLITVHHKKKATSAASKEKQNT